MDKLNGSCECKKISFEITQKIKYFSHCHCSQCRRCHGSAFGSFIEVDKSSFRYSSGMKNIKSYSSSELCKRVFCDTCGSNIMFLDETKSHKYYVSVGLINGNPKLPKAHHVFVGSKAPWYEIGDNLKQHVTYPSSFKNE